MSSALALSAVTSVLQTSLQFVYTSSVFGTITVSAIAPDVVQSKYGIGSGASPLVNLFLHQVTPNAEPTPKISKVLGSPLGAFRCGRPTERIDAIFDN
ncbi:MAG TPA: hypothetical protein VMR02_08105 [Terracidiphilus sp.]|jgi:hypothetical protein|nr:hypothetical protein [Terracidiphilus sp.]